MAASWIAVGRAYVRSFRVSGIVGRVSSWRHYGALVSQSGEKITHTGQVYDDADYRKARFVGKQKEGNSLQPKITLRDYFQKTVATSTSLVNEQFAINLIAEQPVNESASRIVSCDGGGGALGHPKVYINLGNYVQPKNSSEDYFQKDEPTTKMPGKPCATKEFIEGLRPENCTHVNKLGTPRKLKGNPLQSMITSRVLIPKKKPRGPRNLEGMPLEPEILLRNGVLTNAPMPTSPVGLETLR